MRKCGDVRWKGNTDPPSSYTPSSGTPRCRPFTLVWNFCLIPPDVDPPDHRVLQPGGTFLLVTLGEPAVRMQYIFKEQYNWTIQVSGCTGAGHPRGSTGRKDLPFMQI